MVDKATRAIDPSTPAPIDPEFGRGPCGGISPTSLPDNLGLSQVHIRVVVAFWCKYRWSRRRIGHPSVYHSSHPRQEARIHDLDPIKIAPTFDNCGTTTAVQHLDSSTLESKKYSPCPLVQLVRVHAVGLVAER